VVLDMKHFEYGSFVFCYYMLHASTFCDSFNMFRLIAIYFFTMFSAKHKCAVKSSWTER
jgi:hypothetical protein